MRRMMEASEGKMPTTSAWGFTSLFSRCSVFTECRLVLCCAGNAMQASTSSSLSSMSLPSFGQRGRSWSATWRSLSCARLIGLEEGLAQRSRGHGLLGLADMGQGVAHPVHAAALPGGAESAGDRGLQPRMGIGDDELPSRPSGRA